jgi:exopolysaccharide production protein ExoQ
VPGRPGTRGPLSAGAPAAPQRPGGPPIIATLVIWMMIVIMIVPDGFSYGSIGVAMPTSGSPFNTTVWLALLAFGVGVPLSRSALALRLLREVNPFFLLFIGLAALSALWSIDPDVTLRRVFRASTTLLVAVSFTLMSWRNTNFQNVLRPILTLMLVGSIIFVMAAPEIAIEQADVSALVGAWRGLTAQKNGLGSLSAIALILWLHGWLSKEKAWWMAAPGIAISLLCLMKSRSSSSIMGAVFSCSLMLLMVRPPPGMRRYLPYLIVLFVSVLLLYSLAVLNLLPGSGVLLSPITTLTGKDLTFSGRTAIWAIMNEHIAQRPYLGSGYGAYWVQLPGSPSMEMMARLYFYPTEGHNGYLDVINDLGLVGALCLLGYVITYLRQGIRLLASLRPQGILYLTLIFEQLVANLTESRWLNVLTCEFTILTIATICMGRTLLEQKIQMQMQRRSAAANNAPGKPAPTSTGRRAWSARRRV